MKIISLFRTILFVFYNLLLSALTLMKNRKNVEDLIADSLTKILKRSLTLERKDQIAIAQEFKEWLNGVNKYEDIWVINNPIK